MARLLMAVVTLTARDVTVLVLPTGTLQQRGPVSQSGPDSAVSRYGSCPTSAGEGHLQRRAEHLHHVWKSPGISHARCTSGLQSIQM